MRFNYEIFQSPTNFLSFFSICNSFTHLITYFHFLITYLHLSSERPTLLMY